MTVKRIWQVVDTKTIKEDEFIYNYPEDLEELIDPDGLFVRETPQGYKLLSTTYKHESDTVVYLCTADNKKIIDDPLVDITKISEALVAIMEHECCLYGFDDAYKLAKKWQREANNEN